MAHAFGRISARVSCGTIAAITRCMKLRSTLFQLAALLSTVTACSSGGPGALPDSDAGPGGGTDGGPTPGGGTDGGTDGSVQPPCGGCNCPSPATMQGTATPDQACAIVAASGGGGGGSGPSCDAFCASLPGNKGQGYFCTIPTDYQTAYQKAQTDASGSPDGGPTCPEWSAGKVVVQCGYQCLGRRTDGIADPTACDPAELGAVFASRAYLEAVSVHAFARLERELAFHGAPKELLRAARRARREEIRHTAMTVRLARRFGASASLPAAPAETPVRSLFEIARENAVEGCVRETYGAVIGLVEASTSSDDEVRAASRRIAEDECGHAELAMAVARWIEPLLTASDRAKIRAAVGEAIADLRARGDAQIVELLDARVWSAAA